MNIELIEATFRAWICESVLASNILCALHNACAHGQVLTDNGANVTDKQLGKLFNGFDKSLKALRKMEQ